MAGVAPHHALHLLLGLFVEEEVEVMRIFLRAPSVESLVDDQHPQGVAGRQESWRRRVMGCAQQIKAGLLHQPHLADLSSIEGCSPKQAIVMMQASAIEDNRLAVEAEALLSVVFYGANAKGHHCLVQDRAILLCQRQVRRVHLWLLRCPQTWLMDVQESHCRYS